MKDRTFEKGQSTTFTFEEIRTDNNRFNLSLFNRTITFTIDCECELTDREKKHLKELGQQRMSNMNASLTGLVVPMTKQDIENNLKELCSDVIDYLPASSMDIWLSTITLRIRKAAEIKNEAEAIGEGFMISGGISAAIGLGFYGIGKLLKGGK